MPIHSEEMPPGLFFTGTDTGVGKTIVTAAVAWVFRSRGLGVCVSKPIATGCDRVGGRWLSDDTVRLATSGGYGTEWDRVTYWSFPEPVAPSVAARLHGVRLGVDEIARRVRQEAVGHDVVLVEGVGGLLCPLNEKETVADLALALGLPVVIVARRSLGTLNHTLLTVEVARGRGLPVAGVVVNETTPTCGLAEETAISELQQRMEPPILTVVPHRGNPEPRNLPEVAGVDWWGLCQGREQTWTR